MSHTHQAGRPARAKYGIAVGAFLQLAALALLLLSGYPPLLERSGGSGHNAPRCLGSHDLCGCAPERIAAKTCCCAQRISSCCCDGESEETAPSAQGGHAEEQPGLNAAPCGDGAKYLDPVVGELALNLHRPYPRTHREWRPCDYPAPSFPRPGGQTPEPPEPPPKSPRNS